MRIEELVIDGFKSYPNRTVINGWDTSFNAVTGLNGTGKSNILDAICFVLGITNMQQMRASSWQDLIYKRGQAGVTKASVSIIFNNSDRATSPMGLEHCSQVTVTRQISLPSTTKYLVNGHKWTQAKVLTMFQSVQLNINNPNFVIMQGRITKVLNMRPQEILGIVEEAAGTRMFEERKLNAIKTMEKKEKKVQEHTQSLIDDITPKIDKLREEKRILLDFRRGEKDLEHKSKILRALDWYKTGQRVESKEAELAQCNENIEAATDAREQAIAAGTEAEADMAKVVAKRDKEAKKGGKLKQLEENVADLEKDEVKMRTQVEIKNGTIKEETGKVNEQRQALADAQDAIIQKRAEVEKITAANKVINDRHSAAHTALAKSEELLQTLLTGLSSSNSGNSGGGGYMGQLADAQTRLAQGAGEEEQTKTRLATARKDLAEKETKWRAVEQEAKDGKRNLEAVAAEISKLKKKLDGCAWDATKEQAGDHAIQAARAHFHETQRKLDSIKHKASFEYEPPTRDFDHKKVLGLVAKLFTLEKEHYNKATALETAAGAKLHNVVVSDEMVGKALLQKGQLKKRVTILPLTKISARAPNEQKIDAACRAQPGKVCAAITLVGYPLHLAQAMVHVFGDTMICDDADAAKALTFDKKIALRSVTLQGDVYDPAGTLSGGSAANNSQFLLQAQEVLELETTVREAGLVLHELEGAASQGQEVREAWSRLSKDVKLKEHEMALLQQQVDGSNATRIAAEVEALKIKISELEETIKAAKEKQKTAQADCTQLKKDMEEFKDNKDGKIEELKESITKQKKAFQKDSVVVKNSQREHQTAVIDLQQMEADIVSSEETIEEATAAVSKLHEELKVLATNMAESEALRIEAEDKLNAERQHLHEFDRELKRLAKVINDKKAIVAAKELELQKLNHDLGTLAKEKDKAAKRIGDLEKLYPWIEDESHNFGVAGGAFDFGNVDMAQLQVSTDALEKKQKSMKKKINDNADEKLDVQEKREAHVIKSLATVVSDKKKIEKTLVELDRYKREALEKTWGSVSEQFGQIFAELLPGNFAKLQPPEGEDLMDGLEVKVQLGSVWKQSLTELSGGQRSLIALSLIMALLMFKPAPMYILDEIDAALDLSHTQNIGQLFRTRFKGSQFIVVSLKEGLFTNANVLFKTRFRDGTSIVERVPHPSNRNK